MTSANLNFQLISLLTRLAIAALFGAAAINKFVGGIPGVVAYFQKTFESTWLPGWLVTLQANQIAYLEALVALWLVAGYRLQFGWFFTGLVLVSLVFGNQVSMNFPAASGGTVYIIVVCIGIYVSRFDRFVLGPKPSATSADGSGIITQRLKVGQVQPTSSGRKRGR